MGQRCRLVPATSGELFAVPTTNPAMPLFSCLIRFLLIASLILNGSGLAWVSDGAKTLPLQDQDSPSRQGAQDLAARHDAKPPCHEAMGASKPAPGFAGSQSPDLGDAAGSDASDCCESGSCVHTCHQQLAPAAMLVAFLPPLIMQSQHASRSLPSAHDAPALHRLIRPPIA